MRAAPEAARQAPEAASAAHASTRMSVYTFMRSPEDMRAMSSSAPSVRASTAKPASGTATTKAGDGIAHARKPSSRSCAMRRPAAQRPGGSRQSSTESITEASTHSVLRSPSGVALSNWPGLIAIASWPASTVAATVSACARKVAFHTGVQYAEPHLSTAITRKTARKSASVPPHAATGVARRGATDRSTAPSAAHASVIHGPLRASGMASVRKTHATPMSTATVASSSETRRR